MITRRFVGGTDGWDARSTARRIHNSVSVDVEWYSPRAKIESSICTVLTLVRIGPLIKGRIDVIGIE
jgi:hypothetical protein